MAPSILRCSLIVNRSKKLLIASSNVKSLRKLLSTKTSASPISSEGGNKKSTGFDEVKDGLKQLFNDEVKDNGVVPVFKKALLYGEKIAIKDQISEFSFSRIYTGAKKLSIIISNLCGSASSARVAFLCPNDVSYVITQWACWFSGQVAVPLSSRHPSELLEYFITDSAAQALITTTDYLSTMEPIAKKLNLTLLVIDNLDNYIPTNEQELEQGSWLDPKNENVLNFNNQLIVEGALNGQFYADASALMLYTSGTTGRPKGVVITHRSLNTHVNSLTNAWQFDKSDAILHCLPLHHIHGIVNALTTPLSVGAKVTMLPQYDSDVVWSHLLNVNKPAKDRVNVFMAVPTIYSLLIKEFDKIFSNNSQMTEYIKSHCKAKIRLMLSGSAPLPGTIMQRWHEITGHQLLERYGMTETGMVLSNPYIQDKTRKRNAGCVGHPLPHYEVRITKPNEPDTILLEMRGLPDKGYWNPSALPVFEQKPASPQEPAKTVETKNKIIGDLYVRSPGLFKEYWRRPEETAKEFFNGWFRTGDSASFEEGVFKILGRTSVDIIKTGGFKVSALEVETQLLEHENISDIAILGVPDETWGQHIGAVIVTKDGKDIELEDLKVWAVKKLASYAVPTMIRCVKVLPRNAMGKVNKKELLKSVFTEAPKDE